MSYSFLPPADELQIRNLIARYAFCADSGDGAGYADLFVEDGSFTHKTAPPDAPCGIDQTGETVHGRAALTEMVAGLHQRFHYKIRHQMTDILVQPGESEDRAKVNFRALASDWTKEGDTQFIFVYYDGECARVDGLWKIAWLDVYSLTY